MFTSNGTRQFVKKLESFWVLRHISPFGFRKIIVNHLHSVHESRSKTPLRRGNRPIKKPAKLFKRQNVDPPGVYTRDNITKISNILRSSTWDSAEEQLNKFPIKWDSFTVNQVLKTHPPMEKAWLFFNWASKLKGFKHDQFTYTTMLDIFGEARRISSMKSVFQQMQEKGIKIDAVTYTSLLHWLSNDGDVDGSVKLWQEMQAKGCQPTVVSYTAYMKILFDHNRVETATQVYKEMLEAGCKPNCYTYTVLMEHLASSGKFKEVLEIFSKMQEAGVQPDKATCNILVEKCCKAGETKTMMEILHYMKRNFLVLRYPVYKEALHTLTIAGESDVLLREVNRHFCIGNISKEKMENSNASSTDTIQRTTDNNLILSLISKSNLNAIDCLLVDMIVKGTHLDSWIISKIITVICSHGRHNSALMALEYCVKEGIHVERPAWLAAVGEFIRTNSLLQVVEIVEKMVKAGLSLGPHVSALLIYRLGSSKDPLSAAKVFSLLPDEEKSTITYTALLGAYFCSGNSDKGIEIFQTMRRQGINVTLGTYRLLLDGLERSGRVHELDFFRKEKKSLVISHNRNVLVEETLCDLLFAGNLQADRAR